MTYLLYMPLHTGLSVCTFEPVGVQQYLLLSTAVIRTCRIEESARTLVVLLLSGIGSQSSPAWVISCPC